MKFIVSNLRHGVFKKTPFHILKIMNAVFASVILLAGNVASYLNTILYIRIDYK